MNREKGEVRLTSLVVALSFIMCLTTLLAIAPSGPAVAEFVFATWDWPDDYSQGIQACLAYENSTGSWLDSGLGDNYENLVGFEWNVSLGLMLVYSIYLNSTLTQADNLTHGQSLHRENITIYDRSDNLVFSQNGLTLFANYSYGVMYQYYYSVVLEFEMLEGEAYQVFCTCEIYYVG